MVGLLLVGRTRKLTAHHVAQARDQIHSGGSPSNVVRLLDVGRSTRSRAWR
jgi:hypothetical protein